ncbi:MAG TPA: SDR family NAD(P)-dependent oxidoreductase [Polyangiaceae bacterium]|jgi:NAD(P)-dependent dehydrogenase (short-subunit alcohol dehydrogenase family)|nr:SDR family NAD(P)-dependent oxidoreductase [Polyangiaceae bacterium]
MARIFITGSSDGLGLMAGKRLADEGHRVTLHARNDARANDAKKKLPAAEHVVTGDVATLAGMRSVAEQANATGPFDAVIHNVAIGYQEPRRVETTDGIERVFAINVLAPYVLTALILRPKRLVYLSSGLHRSGETDLRDPQWKSRRWNGSQAYSDSKLWNVVLAFAVARRWPDVLSNALEPGWVATKMGGPGAPDDLALGAVTQAWLAVGSDPKATVTGAYFFHQNPRNVHPASRDPKIQDAVLAYCESLSGVSLP